VTRINPQLITVESAAALEHALALLGHAWRFAIGISSVPLAVPSVIDFINSLLAAINWSNIERQSENGLSSIADSL